MKTGSNKRISLKLYGKRPERAGEYDLLPGRHAQASYRAAAGLDGLAVADHQVGNRVVVVRERFGGRPATTSAQ